MTASENAKRDLRRASARAVAEGESRFEHQTAGGGSSARADEGAEPHKMKVHSVADRASLEGIDAFLQGER